ncbi:MAG: glucose 1-dehydrogenase [Chloroflexi bacterium]|nr:glucose 1-dehydrogenase [Chloroflexota bacterium]
MSDPVLDALPMPQRFRLDQRNALITGAGQGIGRAFAHALAESGARVAVIDLNLAAAEAVATELTAKGADAFAMRADVTSEADIERMVAAVAARWGGLHIAFNNAGIGLWRDSEAMTAAEWDRILDVNLKAVFLCCRAEARIMLPAGYGKIINTASMSGSIVNMPQNQAAYNTSKAGVIHLTKSLAAEWAPRGVRVNCISPGYTRTQLVADLIRSPEVQAFAETWLARTPMGRMAEVTDLQGAAVFLSSAASDFMTGHDLVIDGGYALW